MTAPPRVIAVFCLSIAITSCIQSQLSDYPKHKYLEVEVEWTHKKMKDPNCANGQCMGKPMDQKHLDTVIRIISGTTYLVMASRTYFAGAYLVNQGYVLTSSASLDAVCFGSITRSPEYLFDKEEELILHLYQISNTYLGLVFLTFNKDTIHLQCLLMKQRVIWNIQQLGTIPLSGLAKPFFSLQLLALMGRLCGLPYQQKSCWAQE